MKTPDEIKNGLLQCDGDDESIDCDGCPYSGEFNCIIRMTGDALVLIQQLEADNAKKDETIQMLQDGNASLMRMIDEECETSAKLEAELDAAVADLKSYRACHGCKHLGVGFDEPCLHCDFENNCFEWRGVQKEE